MKTDQIMRLVTVSLVDHPGYSTARLMLSKQVEEQNVMLCGDTVKRIEQKCRVWYEVLFSDKSIVALRSRPGERHYQKMGRSLASIALR